MQQVIDTAVATNQRAHEPHEEETQQIAMQMGRQILREHKLYSGLYAHAVKLFGQQGTLELTVTMGDYVLAGIMLITADQQLPPDRPPLLPTR